MYIFVFLFIFLVYKGFYFAITHTHHLGFQLKSPTPGNICDTKYHKCCTWSRQGQQFNSLILWSRPSIWTLAAKHLLTWISVDTNWVEPIPLLLGHLWSGRTGSYLQMNRLSLRNKWLKIKTAGKLPTKCYRGICRMHPNLIKENRKMWTCNRLDSQTLGSQTSCYAQKSP